MSIETPKTLFVVVEQQVSYDDCHYTTSDRTDCQHKAFTTREKAETEALKMVIDVLKDKPIRELSDFHLLGWYDESEQISQVCEIIQSQPQISFKSLMSYLTKEFQILLLKDIGYINVIEVEVEEDN